MTGLLDEYCGFGTGAPPHELHLIADGDPAALDHEAIKRQLAVEAPIDAPGDFLVLNQGVGVV